MTRLTTLACTLTVAATPVFAEMQMDKDNLIRSRDITGGEIYTLNTAMDDDTWTNWTSDGVGADWNDIGEIEDIVLDKDGNMIGVVAEVGGFLDVGDKHVMIETKDLRLTAVDDETYVIVTRRTEEELESMNAVDEAWWN